MLLLEHEGKEILRDYGIPTPSGIVIARDATSVQQPSLRFPAVLKAQIPTGGRGRAGGIVVAPTAQAFETASRALFATPIKGFPVERILVEDQKTTRHEYYLAVMFDGEDQLLLIGARGGVDVESYYGAGRESFATVLLDPVYGLPEFQVRNALRKLSIRSSLWGSFTDMAARLARLFRGCDATLAEINPVAELEGDQLIALDARIVIDDGALFRQPRFAGRKASEATDNIVRRMEALQIQYVPLGGAVGLIGSGAGCGVAIMDWVAREGAKLAAFVDLDYAVLSGQTEAGLRLVLEHFLDDSTVRSIVVNFTACGVRVDLIAESLAIVLNGIDRSRLKPLYAHFEGNRRDIARETMRKAGFPPCERLGDAVRAAAAVAREM
jgi:succinyl-CoA synthetase beta subunit